MIGILFPFFVLIFLIVLIILSISSSITEEKINCIKSGGKWNSFSSCTDLCSLERGLIEKICLLTCSPSEVIGRFIYIKTRDYLKIQVGDRV